MTDHTRNPRHPAIPEIFTREIDSSTGQGTGIYWGPSSENEVIQIYILDPGHGYPLRTEYSISGPWPDVDFMDAVDIADEIATFVNRWNADVIFGDQDGLEVA
ncbi:hypothetical protein [Rothia uropygioeca]|uniref:hypothetical protein n=1 Tax=Kocuria sp. 257 TaxID=2021970 RepID=UPI001013C30A|nr:hypothetical protein [Kocuria sp. 257]